MSSMYFHSREAAGEKLAPELQQYQGENCVVVALSVGGVEVATPIARMLGCKLALLLSENIKLPGESATFGTVNQDGSFVYNNMFSTGEIEEYYSEFHGYIDDQKREKFAALNRLLGSEGLFERSTLRDKVIILVSDGLKTGVSLTAAGEFLKPVRFKRLVIVTPIASVQAVDRMHILADELHCLGATENYISTSHYYDVNDVPSKEVVLERIRDHA